MNCNLYHYLVCQKKDIVDCCQRLKLECKPIAEKVCFFYSFQETQTFPISKYQPPISVGGMTLITLTNIRKEIMKHSFQTVAYPSDWFSCEVGNFSDIAD